LFWRCIDTSKKNELKVAAEILRIAAKGSKEGEIVDRCKMDSEAIETYLSALEELSFLSLEDDNQMFYRTTSKGLEFLKTYHRLRWLLMGKDNDFLLMRLLDKIKQKKENAPFYVS
jgi:predicted transcriptional regulator